MTCRDFIEFLMGYTSGELPPAVRAEFDRHLEICDSCVAYLNNYRKTTELSRAAMLEDASDAVPEEVPGELLQAILAARSRAGDGGS
jgi:anti-sigma factor RsiW